MADIKNIIKNIADDVIEDAKEEIDELQEEIEEAIENDEEFKVPKKKKTTLVMIATVIALFILCVILLIASFVIKKNAASNAYVDAKAQSDSATHDVIKDKIIAAGEERYHTSNELSITIEAIKKQGLLNVLEVKDIYYYIGSENNKKSEAWYKFIGTAQYVVNMNFAEIIVDETRNHIFIRVPKPILQNGISIKTEQYHFEKHFFESVADGVEIAREAELKGREELENSIKNNSKHYEYAESAAKEKIIELAKDFNPHIEVKVEVEFF